MSEFLTTDSNCLETFYASANAEAAVYANNGERVTATASATATSTLNYENAYEVALSTARSVALSNAQTDANIINQSFPRLITLENLSSSNNIYNINDNSNYFYVKGSTGNSNNMTPTFFPMGFSGINASAIDSKGNLYVGGNFTSHTGNEYSSLENGLLTVFNNIAKWDGSKWTTLGSGIIGTVLSIAIDVDDNVLVGGTFQYLGNGVQANNIALWKPTTNSWSVLGVTTTNGVNDSVNAIVFDQINNTVYVGGTFTFLGDLTTSVNRVAKWNILTGTWSALENGVGYNGVNGSVNTLIIGFPSILYIGGSFTQINGSSTISALRIAKFNIINGNWNALIGSNNIKGLSGSSSVISVLSLAIDSQNLLYLAGSFTTFSNNAFVNRIAIWNDSTNEWGILGSSSEFGNGFNNTINKIIIDSNDILYIGGNFTICYASNNLNTNYISKYNIRNSTWSTIGNITSIISNGLSNVVNTLVIDSSKNILYANSSTSGLFQLLTNYINLYYDNQLVAQVYSDGQILNIYTYNKNGKKICSVMKPAFQFS